MHIIFGMYMLEMIFIHLVHRFKLQSLAAKVDDLESILVLLLSKITILLQKIHRKLLAHEKIVHDKYFVVKIVRIMHDFCRVRNRARFLS